LHIEQRKEQQPKQLQVTSHAQQSHKWSCQLTDRGAADTCGCMNHVQLNIGTMVKSSLFIQSHQLDLPACDNNGW